MTLRHLLLANIIVFFFLAAIWKSNDKLNLFTKLLFIIMGVLNLIRYV